MADKEINPKDPQATEVADNSDERDESERKSQALRAGKRVAGRKTSAGKFRI